MLDIARYGYFDVRPEGETGKEGEHVASTMDKMMKTRQRTKLHCAVNLTELQVAPALAASRIPPHRMHRKYSLVECTAARVGISRYLR